MRCNEMRRIRKKNNPHFNNGCEREMYNSRRGCSVGAAPLQSVVAQTSEMGPAPN